ncbi:heptaprenyl diphosphate synthase [Paenibacillus darwinianus]|uniref:Heptaprenyl diphosphate synthase n=1 Tax=Paenibacillus darwinianus TaxID=1380763 RepID=A0A9W5S2N8_9BACL|nr:polyprenyl synthetase family protein [Paenibacillus darwinianus]EXX91321.1 heptaprenyl diphosphate synthase [Paenibacillus darwinianus]EXX92163.1 heptaprenyl diphosphate synthase [Paenibacillus darwinianus]EXX92495.1 heptaprenyl diphosphate synthase [Paenibacillus darwinianus]
MKLLDIYARMKSDLNKIEKQLELSVTTDHALLSEASLHLLKAGGKRIRPVIVLLAGKFGQYDLDVLQKVAVPLELIHMATLVHDDVIDDADTRRGQLTVKSKWDNRIAMYTGDYIYAKALTIVTELNNPALHQVLSKAIVEMCIGEMEQIRDFFNTEQTVRNYLLRIRRKTALLIAISCRLGAIAAGTDDRTSNRLYRFGYNVGMAFQIRDDLLDLLGTAKQIGKPPGSDIRQGNITLPVLLALREPAIRTPLLGEIARIREAGGQTDCSAAIELIRGSRGIGEAERMSARYIDKAVSALEELPDIPAKKSMKDIAAFVGERNY